MERKLASVRIVKAIMPIENADAIECVSVDGWKLVAKKGEFQVGDKCCYFEIDSFLPVRPEFEFLRGSSMRKMMDEEGFRLKTIKLRGQISQGLALPLSVLNLDSSLEEGTDLTEVLNVKKWEMPIPAEMQGQVKGCFPSFLRKTDQERVQNFSIDIARHKELGTIFEKTEKLDGTSATYYVNNGEFGVCSRNLDLLRNGNTYWSLADRLNLEQKMKNLNMNFAIQGEIVGPGIQGNKYKLKEPMFFVFDIFDIDIGACLGYKNRDEISSILELSRVPTLGYVRLEGSVEDILKDAEGKTAVTQGERCGKADREGIVYKAEDGSFSFKAVSNKFLLKSGE